VVVVVQVSGTLRSNDKGRKPTEERKKVGIFHLIKMGLVKYFPNQRHLIVPSHLKGQSRLGFQDFTNISDFIVFSNV
jgi:hypothetical protein